MSKLNRTGVYSITQYKNGVHPMDYTVKVKSKSGKLYHIGKSTSNDGTAVFYLGKKAGFNLSGTDYRRSKASVVNFLKSN